MQLAAFDGAGGEMEPDLHAAGARRLSGAPERAQQRVGLGVDVNTRNAHVAGAAGDSHATVADSDRLERD